jgi:pyruvate,orthophosphate dikinase
MVKENKNPLPEIMIPVTCDEKELINAREIVDRACAQVLEKFDLKELEFQYGTMIEIPRACLIADKMAAHSDFFSFGTNDLTQMTFGFSRDDIGGFMSAYLNLNILKNDPFQTIDMDAIGTLIKDAVEKGRAARPDLKVGICGEHGGDAESVKFCFECGFDYVSCSPYRLPIARLAAAQAAIEEE